MFWNSYDWRRVLYLAQVSFLEGSIMSSCVKPMLQTNTSPVVLLHGFDRSALCERYTNLLIKINYFLCFCSSLLLILQFLFRVEIHTSTAWGGWFGDLGNGHSRVGILWFRFALLFWPINRIFFLTNKGLLKKSLLNDVGFFVPSMYWISFRILHELERLPSCDVASKRDHLYQVL